MGYPEISAFPSKIGDGRGQYFIGGKCVAAFTFREVPGGTIGSPFGVQLDRKCLGKFKLSPLMDGKTPVGFIVTKSFPVKSMAVFAQPQRTNPWKSGVGIGSIRRMKNRERNLETDGFRRWQREYAGRLARPLPE